MILRDAKTPSSSPRTVHVIILMRLVYVQYNTRYNGLNFQSGKTIIIFMTSTVLLNVHLTVMVVRIVQSKCLKLTERERINFCFFVREEKRDIKVSDRKVDLCESCELQVEE